MFSTPNDIPGRMVSLCVRKGHISGTVNDVAVQLVEARAVTGTIPRFFGLVPADDAAEVGTYGCKFMQVSFLVPVRRNFVHSTPKQSRSIRDNFLNGINIPRC